MAVLPTETTLPYENLDRLVRVGMRPQGMGRYAVINDYVYQQAKAQNPISYDVARALDPARPKEVGIVTGASDPTHYPNGENDGPLGAMVLAEALRRIGHRVRLLVDPQLVPVIGALSSYYGARHPVAQLDLHSPERNAALAPGLQVAVAVEKGGCNPAGMVHAITGYTREGTRGKVDGLFRRVEAEGGVTISAADGVNEVGYGKVYDAVARVAPWATECRCGCGKGVMSSTPVTLLYPAAVANWAAYGIVGAVALYTRDPSLLHTPEAERDIEQIAMDHDVRDGSAGEARLSMDGVPLEVTQAMLTMMRALVETSLRTYERPF